MPYEQEHKPVMFRSVLGFDSYIFSLERIVTSNSIIHCILDRFWNVWCFYAVLENICKRLQLSVL